MAIRTINIYDDERNDANVLDTAVVSLSNDDENFIIDIATEIAYRKHNGIDYESFVEMLAAYAEKEGII